MFTAPRGWQGNPALASPLLLLTSRLKHHRAELLITPANLGSNFLSSPSLSSAAKEFQPHAQQGTPLTPLPLQCIPSGPKEVSKETPASPMTLSPAPHHTWQKKSCKSRDGFLWERNQRPSFNCSTLINHSPAHPGAPAAPHQELPHQLSLCLMWFS